jgi:hypothetical protein
MFCRTKITNLEANTQYLSSKFYGHGGKSVVEDMICFQQAACAYLKYFKANNLAEVFQNGRHEEK